MTRISLGINNCFAVKRWPEPEMLMGIIAQELGVKYVQFSFDLLDPRTSEPVRSKMCRLYKEAAIKYGLEIQSTFSGICAYSYNLMLHPDPGMRMDAVKWFEEAITVTSLLGAEATGGHLGALSMRDWQNNTGSSQLLEEMYLFLQHLSAVARFHNLNYLIWEPMPVAREMPCRIDQAKKFYEEVNAKTALPVYYCLDLGHQCTYTEAGKDQDPYAWLTEVGSFSPMIHIQQTDGLRDHHWPFTKEYNKLGIIDPERVIAALNESGAEEVILYLEAIHGFEENEQKVLDEIKESIDYWRDYLE